MSLITTVRRVHTLRAAGWPGWTGGYWLPYLRASLRECDPAAAGDAAHRPVREHVGATEDWSPAAELAGADSDLPAGPDRARRLTDTIETVIIPAQEEEITAARARRDAAIAAEVHAGLAGIDQAIESFRARVDALLAAWAVTA